MALNPNAGKNNFKKSLFKSVYEEIEERGNQDFYLDFREML